MNLATLAQEQAARYGSRQLALVNDEPVTYEQLAERSGRFTAGLKSASPLKGAEDWVSAPFRGLGFVSSPV